MFQGKLSEFKQIFDRFLEEIDVFVPRERILKTCIQALIFTQWVKRMQLNDHMLKC